MPFQSKDVGILNQQLKVQEVSIRFEDTGLYTASGAVVTVPFNETIVDIVAVVHCDDSGPTAQLVASASCVVSASTSMVITLANALAANDVLVIKYVTQE